MSIYISTGGFNKISAIKAIDELKKVGVNDIELSGGKYEPKLLNKIIKFKKLNLKAHNYFPPAKKPFVMNLASLDKTVYKKSEALVLKAIKLSKDIKSSYYSFHAGFLCDISPKDLGKRVKKISKVAQKHGIKLMIENNVITKNNLLEFKENPFLMADPEEAKKIISLLPNNVGLLLDVAHLKVSAKTLGFEKSEMFSRLKGRIYGYHLSENNGKRDSNKSFSKNSWFWKYIPKKSEYVSIEVYNQEPKKLLNLLKLVKRKLNIN